MTVLWDTEPRSLVKICRRFGSAAYFMRKNGIKMYIKEMFFKNVDSTGLK
jgi:hypothetical protein